MFLSGVQKARFCRPSGAGALFWNDPGAARFALAPGYPLIAPTARGHERVRPVAPSASAAGAVRRHPPAPQARLANSPRAAGAIRRYPPAPQAHLAGSAERRRRGQKVAPGTGERRDPAAPG
jgi:hypothetical protein